MATHLRFLGILAVSTAMISTAAPPAAAQDSEAQATLYDASIRAAGMGRVGSAVFWDGDPNQWVNPALLPYHQGIGYEHGTTQLVPDLASDIYFTSDQITLAGWGIGISIGGWPVEEIGGNDLDYGEFDVTDPDGNVIAEVNLVERINAIGIGVSVFQAAENIGRELGWDLPAISRFADVSLGHTWKTWNIEGAEAFGLQTTGETELKDWGLLARVTPYNGIDHPGMWPGLESLVGARVDVSYAISEINYNDATVAYTDPGFNGPVAQDSHEATAVHAALSLPARVKENARAGTFGWLLDFLTPLVSFGASWEKSQYAIDDVDTGSEIELEGWEVTLANVVTFRSGHVEDPTNTIVGDTSGWGIRFQYRDVAGVRFDRATVPQSIFLGDVTREGFGVFVDPFELAKALRED